MIGEKMGIRNILKEIWSTILVISFLLFISVVITASTHYTIDQLMIEPGYISLAMKIILFLSCLGGIILGSLLVIRAFNIYQK